MYNAWNTSNTKVTIKCKKAVKKTCKQKEEYLLMNMPYFY